MIDSSWSRGSAWYVDPIAVERLAAGDRCRVTPKERRAAAQLLTLRGLSATEIGERLACTSRTVQRARAAAPVEVSAFG